MRRLIGGPMDGEMIESRADVIELAEAPGMAYHRTYLPLTPPDPDWYMHGKDEPSPPETVYEWHERGWIPPAVAELRGLIAEATERVFGSIGDNIADNPESEHDA